MTQENGLKQWRIQGGAREGKGTPLFLDQPEKNIFLETVPPFSKGLDDRLPPVPSPYLKVWIQHYEVITIQRHKICKLILHFLSCCLVYKLK